MRNAVTKVLIGVAAVAMLVASGCGRPTSSSWTADDSQRAAASLADSLLAARWRSDLPAAAEPSLALEAQAIGLAPERVEPELIVIELRKRLVSGGLSVQSDPQRADYLLQVALRKAGDEFGDWLYVADASLVQRNDGSVVWADSVQVRKREAAAPATPGGKASMAHDRKQPGDRIGSHPENQATNRSVNLHVTKTELSEAQLLRELAELRRIDGVRSIQEQVDERGTARLLVYVQPHRELEVRQRLLERGWQPIRY